MSLLKLYMILLGCKPQGRHVEQHDVFFGIADSLKELTADMKAFWPDSGQLHIDAWRQITAVDGHQVNVFIRPAFTEQQPEIQTHKLFFINLGGYQQFKFEEQHYMLITIKPDRIAAIKEAKKTLFFQHNHYEKAVSHIDDKYGIDVDDIYEIEDILSVSQKNKYRIVLSPSDSEKQDEIHLGYLKLSALR